MKKERMMRMPATVTHAYFAMDLYNFLPIGLKKLLMDEKAHLRMFAQSMDALYFYRIFSLRKGKRQRQFAHYFHEHDSQAFFINLINYIKYNQYYKNAEVMAYLYGMIAHYILDSTIHPYILYQTGFYDSKKKETWPFRNLHDEAETCIDLYMITKREKQNPYSFRFDQYCFDQTHFSAPLEEVIDASFHETFEVSKMHLFYERALKEMQFFLRWIRYDRFGVKYLFYSFLEGITFKKTFHFHVLSYHLPKQKISSYLNLEKEIWTHPARKQEKHTESFDELYEKALEKAKKTIFSVNDYLQDKKEVDLKKIFPNSSYISGKNCEKEYTYLYRKEDLNKGRKKKQIKKKN